MYGIELTDVHCSARICMGGTDTGPMPDSV